ncbi:flagellar basal body-associated protein FliL [Limnohabitans sp. Rim8]|uniref:flagellar basal body-associated FliL family protein n=1 Tax=Limnohabitans sp. Rim8 TaxID=1100718 RepID=UPI0026144165|nr:flagellar basal body-associated FliL family protein [Limnohabitans sp. Rim8]
MAEEVVAEVEAKPKKPILLIILGVVGVIVLVAGTVVATLFLSGAFNPKPPSAQELEAAAAAAAGADGPGPSKEDCLPKLKEKGEAKGDAKPGAKDGGKDAKADCPKGAPGKVAKSSPELTRFEKTYMQIDREFLVNLSGSKKVMSVQMAVMTHYDDRVFENIKRHDFALRSAVMDVMRMTTEADLVKPEFRKELALKIRDVMNTLLEKFEDFGGIEDVFFTNFIVQ